jgi:LmbE family N-acetylglucosaminyl deacetylase
MSKVLVIAPHMDDEALGCGGTIARHVDEGDEVEVCVLCNRAYDRVYDQDAIRIEKECAKVAQEVLAYERLRFLDLPDEQLYLHFQEVLDGLEAVVEEVRPGVVYTCHGGDLHQDHRTVAHASNIALRAFSAPSVRRVLSYEVPSGTDQVFPGTSPAFDPTVYVDIEGQLARKLDAMAAYDRESRAFPHPRSPEALTAQARVRGAQSGLSAAEAFVLLRETV